MAARPLPVRATTAADQAWVEAFLRAAWGDGPVHIHGEAFNVGALPALIVGDNEGVATYLIDAERGEAELITLNALERGKRAGSALTAALMELLAGHGIARLRVTTTNDNLNALGFYQRRGFKLVGVRPNAVAEARKLKPSIPLIGENGIPLNDEIDLVLELS